jgi:hypothetical protein
MTLAPCPSPDGLIEELMSGEWELTISRPGYLSVEPNDAPKRAAAALSRLQARLAEVTAERKIIVEGANTLIRLLKERAEQAEVDVVSLRICRELYQSKRRGGQEP